MEKTHGVKERGRERGGRREERKEKKQPVREVCLVGIRHSPCLRWP